MKKIAGALALLFLSSAAHAALQITYSGNLLNDQEGNFAGQLTFEPLLPDFHQYHPGEAPASGDLNLAYGGNSFASSQQINTAAFNILNTPLFIYIEDNVTVTQDDIDTHGYNDIVSPGTYDFFGLQLVPQDNRYDGRDLIYGSRLSLLGIFDSNAFDDNDLATENLQKLMKLPTPLHTLFEAERRLGEQQDFRATGLVNQLDVTEVSKVPLPGAVWLFITALAGFGFSRRRKA